MRDFYRFIDLLARNEKLLLWLALLYFTSLVTYMYVHKHVDGALVLVTLVNNVAGALFMAMRGSSGSTNANQKPPEPPKQENIP